MTIHYHGTPISPAIVYKFLRGRHFCVSFADPRDVERAHIAGQSVMLDNGAFSNWRSGKTTDWMGYYAWTDKWLDHPNTWAVIPDVITGSVEEQDELLVEWPHGARGAPVWHMHEPLDRLVTLVNDWPRVCIGSSSDYSTVLSSAWRKRMDETWDRLDRAFCRTPHIHMLRGMQCVRHDWPFASVDSTDVARNHNRGFRPDHKAEAWDGWQCPARWEPAP